jgi:CubicO group peptidase (beta-lactamase class C family)
MRVSLWIVLMGVCAAGVPPAQAQYFPPVGSGLWETEDPADLGWDSDKAEELRAWLDSQNTRAFVVLHGGRIAMEAYFGDFRPDSAWVWYSAAKSLTAVLVGMAQEEGLLSIDDRTSNQLGRWSLMTRAREDAVTIRHQLTMTTGLDETVAFACTLRACLQYRAAPGERWAYHNAPYNLLRNVVEAASGQDITTFTQTRLGAAIGLEGYWERSGFNEFFYSTARSAARFGLLMEQGGVWDSRHVLADTAYVASLTRSSQELNPSYGRLWWLNGKSSYIEPGDSLSIEGPIAPQAPPDVFLAAGSQGQFVSIAPSLDLVVVRMGLGSADLVPLELHDEMWNRLLAAIGTKTGVADTPEMPEWSVSPNPAQGIVRISAPAAQGQVTLIDVLGRETALTAPLSEGRAWLDVSLLRRGVYFVVLRGRTGVRVRPVVVR